MTNLILLLLVLLTGMVAIIGLDIAGVEKICAAAREKSGQSIAIANYLVDGNYAISGE